MNTEELIQRLTATVQAWEKESKVEKHHTEREVGYNKALETCADILKNILEFNQEIKKGASMKLVGVDNLNRESVADILVVENIPNDPVILEIIKKICDHFNEITCYTHGGTFYKLVNDGYRLSCGMEDLM